MHVKIERSYLPLKLRSIAQLTKNSVTKIKIYQLIKLLNKARFKRRILHVPNRIAELSACKMRRLNQLNATYFN